MINFYDHFFNIVAQAHHRMDQFVVIEGTEDSHKDSHKDSQE